MHFFAGRRSGAFFFDFDGIKTSAGGERNFAEPRLGGVFPVHADPAGNPSVSSLFNTDDANMRSVSIRRSPQSIPTRVFTEDVNHYRVAFLTKNQYPPTEASEGHPECFPVHRRAHAKIPAA